jgi:hypothetical protein
MVRDFVRDEMPALLSGLGEVHFCSATEALNNIALSGKPDREVTIAIGHLQDAASFFRVAQACEAEKFFFSERKYFEIHEKEMFCTLLILLCYVALADEQLSLKYADKLYRAWLIHAKVVSGQEGGYRLDDILNEGDANIVELCTKCGLENCVRTKWRGAPDEVHTAIIM